MNEIDLRLGLDLCLDMDELLKEAQIMGNTDELRFNVIPAVFTSRDGNIVETIYLTTSIDTAKLFNEGLDDFSSSTYFVLPEGKEVRNEKALGRFELKTEISMLEDEIKSSIKEEFNNQYLRAMLEA